MQKGAFQKKPRLIPEMDDPGRPGLGQMLRDGPCAADVYTCPICSQELGLELE